MKIDGRKNFFAAVGKVVGHSLPLLMGLFEIRLQCCDHDVLIRFAAAWHASHSASVPNTGQGPA